MIRFLFVTLPKIEKICTPSKYFSISFLIENRAYNMLFSRKYDEALENTLRSMRAEAFVEIKELD